MTAIASKPNHGAALGTVVGGIVIATDEFQAYLDELEQSINTNLLGRAVRLPSYTVSTLPPAAPWVEGLVYVSDETGGAVVAFSDGTNWRRVTDRVVVS